LQVRKAQVGLQHDEYFKMVLEYQVHLW